jgi:hypothetical protein
MLLRPLLSTLLLCLPCQGLTFAEFMTQHSLTGSDALPDADPDHDRIVNLLEYALDGMDPTALDAGSASMPYLAFARRIGSELGEWEWAGRVPPTDGEGGIFHTALVFVPRPSAVGIRYIPQISDTATLERWFDGCSALRSEVLSDGSIMSVSLTQGQRYKRFFMRLEVIEDEGLTDPLSGFTVNGQAGLALLASTPTPEPRVISGGSSSSVAAQDMNVTRTTGATTATDWRWEYLASPYNFAPLTVTRSADPALLTPSESDPYLWTYVGSGAVQLMMSTQTSTYRTNVTTSTATGQTVDVWVSNVSGSLRAEVDSEIDTRISGETPAAAVPLFTTRTPGTSTYVRNVGCWGADIDLTPYAAYNSETVAYQPGVGGITLITPRHVIGATHTGHPSVGTTYHFVTADNTVCSRTVTAATSIGTTDVRIGLLSSAVDAGIDFCRVLPDSWAAKLPTLSTRHLACARINREQKLVVHELHSLSAWANFQTPRDATRATFNITPVSGDSSSPLFLVINGEMVLLTTLYSPTGGTSVIGQRSAINAAITSLGGGYTQLTDADLSGFTTF